MMMIVRRRWLARLFLVALLGLASLGAAQDDVAQKVERFARISANKGADAAWPLATRLKQLGPEVVEALAPHLDTAGTAFRIAAASTLIHFGDRDRGTKILLDIGGNEKLDLKARTVAIRILGSQGTREAAPDVKRLMERTRDPLLKLEMAKALWYVSINDRPEAKKVLRDYLKSEDPDLQAAGALALAEIRDFDAAKQVLETLKDEPTPRGQLARSYLRTMENWRQLEKLVLKGSRFTGRANRFDLLDEVLRYIKQYHLTGDKRTEEELLETAARNILRALDPSSTYLTADHRADLLYGHKPEHGDIGAIVDFDRRGVLSIVRVCRSGPAYSAGLRTDDKIIEVDGLSTFDRDLEDLRNDLSGPLGTSIKIKVVRRGWKEPRTIALERVRCDPCPVRAEVLPGRIGFVRIACFRDGTVRRFDEALGRLVAQKVRGLVLDLRDNNGEDLTAAAQVVDRFLAKDKLVVYWEGRNRFVAPREEIRTTTDAAVPDLPMAVLINERTSNAAEVVAGALGYYKRAILVGQHSLGRGTVQKVLDVTSKQEGDRFIDTPRLNGQWDPGESFRDENNNGRYDPGEPFEDQARRNGVWDPGEPFKDLNKDGKRSEGEPFTDENRNGQYDGPEPYTDRNRNGRFDVGPGIRITIARYYLPDGRTIQQEIDSEGEIVHAGGIEPDVTASFDTWPGWKEEELEKLIQAGRFKQYIDQHWETHRKRLTELAAFDGRDASRYPEFDAFFRDLGTHLTREDVRRWLRAALRRKVESAGGPEYAGLHSVGDFEEDRQLEAAIREVLKRLDPPVDPKSIPEYAVFKAEGEEKEKKEAEEKKKGS